MGTDADDSSTSTNDMLALGFVHDFRSAGSTAFTSADGSTVFASWSRQVARSSTWAAEPVNR